MELDVLYVTKNLNDRAIQRLKNSINSLKKTNCRFRVAIADDSDDDLANNLNKHDVSYDKFMQISNLKNRKAKYILHDGKRISIEKYFNKSCAINAGFKHLITSNHFIFSDIDILFEEDFINKLSKFHLKNNNPYSYGKLFKLPVESQNDTPEYDHLLDRYADQSSKYGCQVGYGFWMANSQAFKKISGFNEQYFGWGCEDDDFDLRMKKEFKLNKKRCCSGLIGLHQYHPNRLNVDFIEKILYERNKKILNDTKKLSKNKKYLKIKGKK